MGFLDDRHVLDSQFDLEAESILLVGVVHVTQVVDLFLSDLSHLKHLLLLIVDSLLVDLHNLFLFSFDALESVSLGHLGDIVLELVDHLNVRDYWFRDFLFFFEGQDGFVIFFDGLQNSSLVVQRVHLAFFRQGLERVS